MSYSSDDPVNIVSGPSGFGLRIINRVISSKMFGLNKFNSKMLNKTYYKKRVGISILKKLTQDEAFFVRDRTCHKTAIQQELL